MPGLGEGEERGKVRREDVEEKCVLANDPYEGERVQLGRQTVTQICEDRQRVGDAHAAGNQEQPRVGVKGECEGARGRRQMKRKGCRVGQVAGRLFLWASRK